MIKKPKKFNRKLMIKKLDKAVSVLVVARDKVCITCGSDQKLGCGHLFSRIAYSTRWDLFNCHAQCWPCNFKHEHDSYPYTKFFLRTYGRLELDELHKRYSTPRKFRNSDLIELLERLSGGNK